MKKKKVIALLFAFGFLGVSTLGVINFQKSDAMANAGELMNFGVEKHVEIGGYYMPSPTMARLKIIKDCGFDYIVVDDWTSIQKRDENGNNYYGANPQVDGVYRASLNADYLSTVLENCEEVELGALIMNPYGEYQKTSNTSAAASDDSRTLFGNNSYVTVDYTQYTSFWGFTVSDEPYYNNLWKKANGDQKDGWLYTQAQAFASSKYSDYWFDVNLFPYGANLAFSHESNGYESYTDWDKYSTNLVKNVLGALGNSKKVAMFDSYPFGTTTMNVSGYLKGYDIMADKARDNYCDFASYIQSVAWADGSRHCNKAELEFQIFINLVFGAKGFRYFTVWTPEVAYNQSGNEVSAMISRRGYPTNTYYNIQELNRKVKSFDSWMLNYTWKGVKALSGTVSSLGAKNYITNSRYNPAEIVSATSEYDALIGCYADDTGLLKYNNQAVDTAYVVMNYTDPMQGHKNTVSLTFQDATKVLVFADGQEPKEIELDNHVFTTRLDEGEGLFIMPI